MIWLYVSSVILLFGAEFARAWSRSRGRDVVPEPGAVRTSSEDRAKPERSHLFVRELPEALLEAIKHLECGSLIAAKNRSYDAVELCRRGRPDGIDRIRVDCRQYDPAAVGDCRLRLLLDQCPGGCDPQYPHFRPFVTEQCAFNRCNSRNSACLLVCREYGDRKYQSSHCSSTGLSAEPAADG